MVSNLVMAVGCHIHIFLPLQGFYHQILSTFFLEMIPTCSYFLIKSHTSNQLRPLKFSLKQVKSGWSIVCIEGSKIIFLKKCLFLSVQTLMKCHIMWHFIWVFTVYHLKYLFCGFWWKKNMLNFQIFSWYA